MDKPEGTKMARTEVTKYVIQYIKDNNLPQGKVIKPDKKLEGLLLELITRKKSLTLIFKNI